MCIESFCLSLGCFDLLIEPQAYPNLTPILNGYIPFSGF